MKKISPGVLLFLIFLSAACNEEGSNHPHALEESSFHEGEFGFDLAFLKKQDSTLVVLKEGEAQLIVSPKYQAKVFTSTASGEHAMSYGWINYKAFGAKVDPHMNAYGGENRLWLGPEGGKYSLFFKPGNNMVFDNWKTPSAFDTESWTLRTKDNSHIVMFKEANLENYSGTTFKLLIERAIKILDKKEIIKRTGITELDSLFAVGYETNNILTNTGKVEWTATTGMPCIWMLDMLKPSPATVIVVPFQKGEGGFKKAVTANYFGEISPDRLKHNDSLLLFKADGNSRGKLGIAPDRAVPVAGSYDAKLQVLTIILFDLDGNARYLNQEWNVTKPPFSGDAVNAYNDGPLADGSLMGPFYEIESVSPAAFLKPGQSLMHRHSVLHFSGSEKELDNISVKLLGISLQNIVDTF